MYLITYKSMPKRAVGIFTLLNDRRKSNCSKSFKHLSLNVTTLHKMHTISMITCLTLIFDHMVHRVRPMGHIDHQQEGGLVEGRDCTKHHITASKPCYVVTQTHIPAVLQLLETHPVHCEHKAFSKYQDMFHLEMVKWMKLILSK